MALIALCVCNEPQELSDHQTVVLSFISLLPYNTLLPIIPFLPRGSLSAILNHPLPVLPYKGDVLNPCI